MTDVSKNFLHKTTKISFASSILLLFSLNQQAFCMIPTEMFAPETRKSGFGRITRTKTPTREEFIQQQQELAARQLRQERADIQQRQARADFNFSVPIATLLPFAGAIEPQGWLMCNGQIVARQKYEDLYKKLLN